MKCEIMICDLRDNYKVDGDDAQGPSQDEFKGKLGKRQRSPSPVINENAAKRQKVEEKGAAANNKDKEEEKKIEEIHPTRRSARNVGKEANYNLDELLAAAD